MTQEGRQLGIQIPCSAVCPYLPRPFAGKGGGAQHGRNRRRAIGLSGTPSFLQLGRP